MLMDMLHFKVNTMKFEALSYQRILRTYTLVLTLYKSTNHIHHVHSRDIWEFR